MTTKQANRIQAIRYPDGAVAYFFQPVSCRQINWADSYTYKPDGSLHTA